MKHASLNQIAGAVTSVGATALSTYIFAIRPWHLRWGATDEEVKRALPGDDLVPAPKLNATHAITIDAPPAEVWPWLAQIGQGRGGFYSYDWLENLMGLNIHSADRILPEYQHLKVGDIVPFAPGGFGPPVAAIERGRALVLGGKIGAGTEGPFAIGDKTLGAYMNVSWQFFIELAGGNATRLIERFRLDWEPPSLKNFVFYHLFLEPGSFIMERKMLLGIKQRVEAAR